MKNSSSIRSIRMALFALVTCAFVSKSLASSVDMYLEIKDDKGKVTKVTIGKDGSFTTPPLKVGVYSWQWGTGRGISSPTGASADRGASSPSKVCVTYSVKSPRDLATGQASGKRMHKPFTITKEIDKSTPLLRCALDSFTLDEDCDGISGTVECKDTRGKTMAMDDWTQTK